MYEPPPPPPTLSIAPVSGATDEKHFLVQCPPGSGSLYIGVNAFEYNRVFSNTGREWLIRTRLIRSST